MKNHLKKSLCILLTWLFLIPAFTACGIDPNIKREQESKDGYKVIISDAEEKEREGFHSYPSGETDPVTVGGVEVSVTDFALRSYELAYMVAQPDFSSVKNIEVDPLVQFALTHVFFKNPNEMNNKTMQYRSTDERHIKEQLVRYFGRDDFNIKNSTLYNAGKNLFEMWIPKYGCNIYYNIDAVKVEQGKAEISTTFYNEFKRMTMRGKTKITVKIYNGKPVIDSLSSE